MVELELAADTALLPYLPVIAWETVVDGYAWAFTLPGAGDAPELRSRLRLFTACDGLAPVGRAMKDSRLARTTSKCARCSSVVRSKQ